MTAPQRDRLGRWLPGTPSPNPDGRPPRATEERVRERFSAALTDDAIDSIIGEAIRGAMDKNNPDRRADREFVARYAFPRPAERLSVSRGDGPLDDLNDAEILDLFSKAVDADDPA